MSWTRGAFHTHGMSGDPTTISSQSSPTASPAEPSSSQVCSPAATDSVLTGPDSHLGACSMHGHELPLLRHADYSVVLQSFNLKLQI